MIRVSALSISGTCGRVGALIAPALIEEPCDLCRDADADMLKPATWYHMVLQAVSYSSLSSVPGLAFTLVVFVRNGGMA